MDNYESVILIKSDLTEEQRNETINKICDFINENGKVQKVDEIGLRKMAYEINNYKESYYVVIYFEMDYSNIAELERLYRITDEVLKYLTVKHED